MINIDPKNMLKFQKHNFVRRETFEKMMEKSKLTTKDIFDGSKTQKAGQKPVEVHCDDSSL